MSTYANTEALFARARQLGVRWMHDDIAAGQRKGIGADVGVPKHDVIRVRGLRRLVQCCKACADAVLQRGWQLAGPQPALVHCFERAAPELRFRTLRHHAGHHLGAPGQAVAIPQRQHHHHGQQRAQRQLPAVLRPHDPAFAIAGAMQQRIQRRLLRRVGDPANRPASTGCESIPHQRSSTVA